EDYARDVERFAASGAAVEQCDRDDIGKALDRLRDHAQSFFTELALAHCSTDRFRGEERVRATESTLGDPREAAAYLTGSLDRLEATLALLKPRPDNGDTQADAADDAAALARRAGEIRDDLRFLLRASDSDYVFFVEFRGKGIFLRASPIDVSKIVRELLFERMRTTVLTSATLTVDGGFEYIRGRL